MAQVDHDALAAGAWEGIAVGRNALAGSELDHYAVAVQHHAVVAGLGFLAPVLEGGEVALAGHVVGVLPLWVFLHHGHKQDVAVVLAAGAAEVGVAETVDGVVAIVVGAAAVPPLKTGVGTGLDLAERRDGPGESVAVEVGADQGIDIAGESAFATAGSHHAQDNK